MGIAASKKYNSFEDYKKPFKEKDKELLKKINTIASKMILETSSKEILKFLEPNYCNSIIQIVANVLKKNTTENNIIAIHSFIKNHKLMEKDILDLNKIEIGKDEITRPKKFFCQEVAIYYVKFSHLYSAIYHVINPILNNKNVSIQDLNFCKKRDMVNDIKEVVNKDQSNINVIVSNHFCDINMKREIDENNKISHKYLKTLGDEAGIKELDDLYKDEYDPIRKKFVMSKQSKKEYSTVLTKIYKTFTGKSLPEDIKNFKDIPLYRYEKNKMCTTKELNFKTGYVGTLSPAENDLLKYVEHIKNIMQITYENNEKFIKILDEMFKKDENTNEIFINEEFTMEVLDEKTKEVRKFLVSMYIDCEKNFRKGIKLFKKIVLNSKLKKIIKMEKNEVVYDNLKKNINNYTPHDTNKDYRTEKYIEMKRDDNVSSVNLLENFEDFFDKIIRDTPSELHNLGYMIFIDVHDYLKKNPNSKNYKGYCIQRLSILIYCLLFCDIVYMEKDDIYYSMIINIFSSVYDTIGKNIIKIPDDKKNLMKIDEFNGVHFGKCCDFDCALSRKCKNDTDCETYECFIKGERWSYETEDGSTDICGKCYNNFENLKEKKEFTKDNFKKQTVRNSFNGDICVKIENPIRFPKNLKSDGIEFRQLWYDNFYNRTWNNIDNDNTTFRVIKDINLNNKIINQYEGISILDMSSIKSTNQYNIDKIENVNKLVHITFEIRPDEKVTGILNKNIIIFPTILKDEITFLNQFITEDITEYTRSGTTSLSQSNTDNSIFKGITDFLNLPKESKMNGGTDIEDADTDTDIP